MSATEPTPAAEASTHTDPRPGPFEAARRLSAALRTWRKRPRARWPEVKPEEVVVNAADLEALLRAVDEGLLGAQSPEDLSDITERMGIPLMVRRVPHEVQITLADLQRGLPTIDTASKFAPDPAKEE